MIAYLKGKIIALNGESVVIETGGVGYKVFVPQLENNPASFEKGIDTELHISHIIRENEQKLFGFSTVEERDFFELLTTVSGVGPKTAAGLLARIKWQELASMIVNSNIEDIVKVPGIGKKTASRLVVELKDKVLKGGMAEIGAKGKDSSIPDTAFLKDALKKLGFGAKEIDKIINQSKNEIASGMSEEDVLKLVLQNVDRA